MHLPNVLEDAPKIGPRRKAKGSIRGHEERPFTAPPSVHRAAAE